jgi:PIN domain nuclease of toxin-antitoxin system
MISGVLDASALLAYLHEERGVDIVAAVMSNAVISSVNLAEVVTRLTSRGDTLKKVRATLQVVRLQVIDFTRPLAEETGALAVLARRRGLSLGDRAFLALAARENVPAFTADRNWASLDIGVEIRLIR